LQKTWLRKAFQVPVSTTIHVMMNEARRVPVMHAWFAQLVTWWNKTVLRDDTDLLKCCLRDSMSLAVQASSATCWAAAWKRAVLAVNGQMHTCLNQLHPLPADLPGTLHDLWHDDVWGVWTQYDASGPELRTIEQSRGFKTATYRHWFCHGALDDNEPHSCPIRSKHGFAHHVNQPTQIRALSTFRMGAHQLNIQRLRSSVPRHLRLCTCCGTHSVEDELHVLECDAYADLRQRYGSLFEGVRQGPYSDADMYTVMNPSDPRGWKRLAAFLLEVNDRRSQMLEQAVLN
jgi:hypothetical protein